MKFMYISNMFKRNASDTLKKLAAQYQSVTILGPRQSGKTTLAISVFPKKDYVNLEEIDARELASRDPRAFLAQFKDGAIIDEIQRVPSLLSYLQVLMDKDQRKGLFILTGSQQLDLKDGISQSLAGRTAILKLLPLTLDEIPQKYQKLDLDELLISGTFPRIYKDVLEPDIAYRNYIETYLEKDLHRLINVKDLSAFQRFLKLCAARIGSVLNKNNISNDLGISSQTIENWLSILEASYIIMRLQPYYDNLGKRMIKSPKLYFADTGLAAYLLDIHTKEQMNRDKMRGALFENMAFLELVKKRYNLGRDHQLYFYRDSSGNEVDFIFKSGDSFIPIEIKSSQTIQFEYFKTIKYFQSLLGTRSKKGYLVYSGKNMQDLENISIINYRDVKEILEEI